MREKMGREESLVASTMLIDFECHSLLSWPHRLALTFFHKTLSTGQRTKVLLCVH